MSYNEVLKKVPTNADPLFHGRKSISQCLREVIMRLHLTGIMPCIAGPDIEDGVEVLIRRSLRRLNSALLCCVGLLYPRASSGTSAEHFSSTTCFDQVPGSVFKPPVDCDSNLRSCFS